MSDAAPSRRRQWLVIGGLFVAVVVLLGGGYYWLRSGATAVFAERVRPGEAAAIVAELDKRGTAYALKDGGTTVLVPAAQADAIRLALVRSDAAASGQIGFELFNKSDMGLTNFAQKINYQRALPGELVRTIMAMDGVETARVHLALPERALFRDDRTQPSAAVTVQMRGQTAPDAAMVAGIQQLVAAAVPDLSAARVVVLDGEGRVVGGSDPAGSAMPDGSSDSEARGAVEHYYRARVRAAIEAVRPGLKPDVRVLALPQAEGVVDPSHWTPGGTGAARNFRLRIIVVTPAALDGETQAALLAAVRPAVALDEDAGDAVLFETGPVVPAPAPAVRVGVTPPRIVAAPADAVAPAGATIGWGWALLAAVGVLALVVWMRASRRPRLSDEAQEAFAETLRRHLATRGEGGHATR